MVMSSIFGKANIEGGEGRKNWRIFLNVMLFSGTITAFYGLFQYFGLAEVHQSASRVDASLGNAAYMAVYMIMNSFIAGYLALVAYKHKLDKKDGALAMIFVYSIIFVLSSFILFQTATRGAIIGWAFGILVACGIYALFGRSKIVGDVERGQSIFSRYFAAGIILFVITSAFALYMAKEVNVFDLKQSMQNGGGPACLRLRVALNETELAAVNPGVIMTAPLYDTLTQWVDKHYRDSLRETDLADPQLLLECRTALDELTQILKLGSVYPFQIN